MSLTRKEIAKRFVDKHKALGLCISCQNPAEEGYLRCYKHILMRRRANKKWRDKTLVGDMLCKARHRAKKAGLPFSITKADIVIPPRCPVLDIPLKIGAIIPREWSPSLDKVIPSKGYVPGNIVVMSRKANWMKSNATLEELVLLGKWAKKMLRSRK